LKRTSETELIWLIWAAFYHTRKPIEAVVHPYGVTAPQIGILNRLADRPGLSGAEISRVLVISPQAVHEALTALERKGLIERRPGSGRVMSSHLTDAGRQVVEGCSSGLRQVGRRLVSVLGPEEQHVLADILRRYTAAPPHQT
jgi:DNA-binding MarR family transcriptional regulator